MYTHNNYHPLKYVIKLWLLPDYHSIHAHIAHIIYNSIQSTYSSHKTTNFLNPRIDIISDWTFSLQVGISSGILEMDGCNAYIKLKYIYTKVCLTTEKYNY